MASAPPAAILIVDDDAGIALLERRALARGGYAVETASTPEEAVARLGPAGREARFDLVVLDYQLGGPGTGLDLYRRLRADWPDLPAILVTGFSDEGKVIEALRAGVRDVVPKVGEYLSYLPLAVERVMAVVQAERRLAESEEALREANEALERRVAERTAELQRTKELAESANQAKDHFLAVLSHELRTPLTPVLATVQLLERRSDLPPDYAEPLAVIRRNVELEARLIDDLLDLTKIARGKLDLHFQPLDVHETLLQVLEICGRDVEAKEIDVQITLGASRHVVRADPARLQQVLWNVVKNAVKFTPEGGRIAIATADGLEDSGVSDATMRIEVADTGVGIEPDVLPRIFDAFEQGGQGVTRIFGGLGLGLAISKALIDLHGGAIEATSAGRDQGATFTISLVAATPERSRAASPPRPDAASAHRPGLRILLVEDHADTREAVAELLGLYGHTVATAGSCAEALARLGECVVDLVVSDLGLPDGSGLDLMREIGRRCGPEVKGICLSGFGMEEDVRQSRDAGFLAHLTKPVDLRELEAVLARVMEGVARPA
jgi:signal transduction histidine kinase